MFDDLLEGHGQVKSSVDPVDVATYDIPCNLDAALVRLQQLFSEIPEELIKFKNHTSVAMYHHSLGQFIRNEWGLWQGSVLAKHFEKLGIFHPDDMSGIIMTSLHRLLNDKPIELYEQIEMYQAYWKDQEIRSNKDAKKEAKCSA